MSRISNSIETFHCVADALGLGRLTDRGGGIDPNVLKALYRHVQGGGLDRVFITNSTFVRGWVDLDSPIVKQLIAPIVALDDADTVKQSRYFAQYEIEEQPWSDILGILSPPIVCTVKIHGSRWAIRFMEGEEDGAGVLKGREVLNEELPPIPGDATEDAGQGGDGSEAFTTPCDGNGQGHDDGDQSASVNALRAGGMPA